MPGQNGPSDYGFNDPYCLPTQPIGTPAEYAWPYPSPNGQENQGNSGEFQGTTTINPVGGGGGVNPDVPAYTTSTSSYPQDSFPNPEPAYFTKYPVPPSDEYYIAAPPGYNQLNDAAIAYAFNRWLANGAPTSSPWFAAVSFINPHDISQFPYGFGVMDDHTQASGCNLFCEPSVGTGAISQSGFEPPGVPNGPSGVGVTKWTPFNSVDASVTSNPETEQTYIARFPLTRPAPVQPPAVSTPRTRRRRTSGRETPPTTTTSSLPRAAVTM